jgi:trigger factor
MAVKSSVQQINTVQYRVNVELSREEVDAAFDAAFKKIQRQARVQGFRPGKAPLGMIRKLYGGHVTQEVHESLINKHLFTALNEQTLRPIATPRVETSTAPTLGQAYNFSAVVDTMPKLEFPDSLYKGIAVEGKTFTVKDQTVERELNMLRRRHAKTRAVEAGTKAAKGLLAAIDHTASQDGVDLPNFRVEGMAVELGAGELFEGLETAVLGMAPGETKTVNVKLPADYGDTEYAGKELTFTITLNDLKHLDIPKLDDEFAKDLDYDGKAALEGDVRTQLESRAKDLRRQQLEGVILDKILAGHPFEVPPAMVDQVVDSMIGELNHRSDDERKQAMRDPGLREHFKTAATRRTQNTLILWHISQKEKLEVTQAETDERVGAALKSFGITDPKQAARLKQNLEARVRENMIFEKAMDFLIDNAKVTDVPAEL